MPYCTHQCKSWKSLCLSKHGWQLKNTQLKDSKLQNWAQEVQAINTAAFISSSSIYWFAGNKAYLHKPRPNWCKRRKKKPCSWFSSGNLVANETVSDSLQPDVECLFYICSRSIFSLPKKHLKTWITNEIWNPTSTAQDRIWVFAGFWPQSC